MSLSPSKSTLCYKLQTTLQQKLLILFRTNISYNLKNNNYITLPLLSRKQIIIQNDFTDAYLLGCCYNYYNRQQFYKHFRNIIWISYDHKTGDVGWSCTIRSFQMMLVEILQRSFPNYTLQQILNMVKNQKLGILSLTSICKKGFIYQEQRWTSFPQILAIISTILKEEKIRSKQIQFTHCSFTKEINIQQISNYTINEFPKLITIYCKVNQNNCKILPQKYIPHLKHLMKSKNFTGIIGGIETQALYIIGHYNDNIIYLDPHYVQNQQYDCTTNTTDTTTTTNTTTTNTDRYFEKYPRGINFKKIASFFIISYYFNKHDQFVQWIQYLISLDRIYQNKCVFQLKINQNQKQEYSGRKFSQEYQILE